MGRRDSVTAGRGPLFLDELSTATPTRAALRVVLERRVGSLQLPPGVRIVAAANPRASAADGWELSPPLANRFAHLYRARPETSWCAASAGAARAEPPRLEPERLADAVALARRAVCGFPGRPPRH